MHGELPALQSQSSSADRRRCICGPACQACTEVESVKTSLSSWMVIGGPSALYCLIRVANDREASNLIWVSRLQDNGAEVRDACFANAPMPARPIMLFLLGVKKKNPRQRVFQASTQLEIR